METTAICLSRRCRKALFSSLVVLVVTFALIMYGGKHGPGDGYQSNVDKLPVEGDVKGRQMVSTDGSVLEWLFPSQDDDEKQRKVGSLSLNNKTVLINEQCDTCCYRYVAVNQGIIKTLTEAELRESGCEQRLPDAMIFGVKKGGTTTLRNFISYHPDIAFTQKELKFFTSNTEFKKGLEYYRRQMIYSTPGQVSMEKTPAYSSYPKVPPLIQKTLPNVKLIIIMRDPIERAVSDFVHMQVTIAKNCPQLTSNSTDHKLVTSPNICRKNTGYFIADTFEESVINADGEIRSSNQLISKGVYVKDIQRYLKYFKKEQILAIDGEAFINNPYPAVKQIEQFLGIRDYFTPDHFYYDVQKGFFCLNKPIPNNCMKPAKGRPHPEVNKQTLDTLREYYRPYNQALKELMNLNFRWSS